MKKLLTIFLITAFMLCGCSAQGDLPQDNAAAAATADTATTAATADTATNDNTTGGTAPDTAAASSASSSTAPSDKSSGGSSSAANTGQNKDDSNGNNNGGVTTHTYTVNGDGTNDSNDNSNDNNSGNQSSSTTSSHNSSSSANTLQQSSSAASSAPQPQKDTISVQVTVDCTNAVNAGNQIAAAVSDNGIIQKKNYELPKDSTAFSALENTGLLLCSSQSAMGVYVSGIQSLKEKACGGSSGWMYYVNDKYISTSCDKCSLQDGDRLKWVYTCNGGKDV